MILIRFLLIFLLTAFVHAQIVHENAEDAKITRWKQINTNNSIKNVLDKQKKSHVLEFLATGNNFAYELKIKKQEKDAHWLSWEMKFSKDFVIIVALDTNRGQHYLVYTAGEGKSYMQYGLGNASKNGKWQTVERDLQKDISYYDNRVRILAIKSFVLKGSGALDNIITKKDRFTKKVRRTNPFVKPPITAPIKNTPTKIVKEEKKKERKIFKLAEKISPVIHLKGAKTVKLQLGEDYVEPGVSAYDEQDGEINVVSMENMDVNQDGRYMILYMATDSDGNIALDKRYVDVGKVDIQKEKKKVEKEEEPEEEPEEELDEGTKERNMQIEVWEKKLQLKELKMKRQNR